jgi:E3 ubiquitin-protein ligase SIS3
VPDDCGECLICLEEFHIGHEVRGLPCAHNFHVECIDQWLRLNVKCPRCRCSVFPDLDLSALSNLQSSGTEQHSQVNTETSEARYIRSQPQSESYFLRVQSLIHPVHTDTALETAENGGVPPVLTDLSPSRRWEKEMSLWKFLLSTNSRLICQPTLLKSFQLKQSWNVNKLGFKEEKNQSWVYIW